jgi:hypothetical protein
MIYGLMCSISSYQQGGYLSYQNVVSFYPLFAMMNIEEIRDHCLAKPAVTEGFPFGQDVLVFKVMNKMFALTGLEGDPPYVNLKCDPERAIELREQYEAIQPGWYMNKVIMQLFNTAGYIFSSR